MDGGERGCPQRPACGGMFGRRAEARLVAPAQFLRSSLMQHGSGQSEGLGDRSVTSTRNQSGAGASTSAAGIVVNCGEHRAAVVPQLSAEIASRPQQVAGVQWL